MYLDIANSNFIHDYRIKFYESLYYNRINEFEKSQKLINKYTLKEKLKNNQMETIKYDIIYIILLLCLI